MIGAKRKPIPVKQASIPLKSILLIALLLGSITVFGQDGSLDIPQIEHISIAPISIPVGPSGTADIGMTRFGCRTANNGDDTSLSSITVQAISDGTFSNTWISGIRVYFEEEGALGEYDHGAGVDDVRADTGAALVWYGTGSDTVDIALDPDVVSITRPGGGLNYLYIVVDLTSSADTTTNLGFEITSVTYGLPGVGTGSTVTGLPPTPDYALHNTKQNLDNYEMTMNATWIGPASAAANASKVGVLQLDFDTIDSSAIGYIDTIKVNRTFGQDNYVATAGVLLYEDVDDDGIFEPDADDGAYITSATLSSGSATLNPDNPSEPPDSRFLVTQAGHTYFIAVNMDGLTAVPGQDFGVNIDNPSTDITFTDEIEDDNDLVPAEYAYVPFDASGLYEYMQVGYITSMTADPAAIIANTFNIDQADDGQPPTVVTTVPDTGATGVDRNTNLTVVFFEWMTEATVIDTANFELTDGVTPVTVGLSYSQTTQTLTVNPSTTLNWGTLYTATVKAAVEDYYNNPMGTDYSWTFTVEPAVYPTVQSTVPTNGETNVARDINLKATFSENVSGVDVTSFTLYQGATPIAGTVSYDGVSTTATFDPTPTLAYNTQYTATITTDVYDDDGLYLQTAKVWSFWTLPATPPAVLSVFPANGTTGVPISSTVQAVFSKPIDEATLTGNFTVEDSLGTPISGAITYDGSSTATFTPATPFGYLKTYTAAITTGVTDTEGTALSAGKTWDFTTFGFDKATIVNNRIVSGGNSETLIFVPVPPSTSDKVSVQVFTTTGKLVRSFYRNATYSSIESQLPIRWDGTNDRGSPLGPGMYFVQIVVAGNKQTLKVMIVR